MDGTIDFVREDGTTFISMLKNNYFGEIEIFEKV